MRKRAPKLFEDVFIKQQLLEPRIEHECNCAVCVNHKIKITHTHWLFNKPTENYERTNYVLLS